MRYLNLRTSYGVETVDELNSKDFSSRKDYLIELKRLISEYHLSGQPVYVSSRCDKSWNSPN